MRTYKQGSNGFRCVEEASCRVNVSESGVFGAGRASSDGRRVLHAAGRA